MEDGAVMHS